MQQFTVWKDKFWGKTIRTRKKKIMNTKINWEDSVSNIATEIFQKNLREFTGMLTLDAIINRSMLEFAEGYAERLYKAKQKLEENEKKVV